MLVQTRRIPDISASRVASRLVRGRREAAAQLLPVLGFLFSRGLCSGAVQGDGVKMAGVLKYTRKDLASLVYHPVRPLDVISDEIGIPVEDIAKVSPLPILAPHAHPLERRCAPSSACAVWPLHVSLLRCPAGLPAQHAERSPLTSIRSSVCLCLFGRTKLVSPGSFSRRS